MSRPRTRILVYVGKGGVGKTTMSAATGLHLAKRGVMTLVVSTDPAHTLGDLLGRPVLGEITRLAPNLEALEINPYREIERRSKEILRYLRHLMAGRGYHDMMIQELLTFPGVDEIVSLMRLKELHADGRWEAIVVDTAPSGGALKLFVLPEAAHWYMNKIYPGEKKLLLLLKPLADRITASALPDAPVYDALESLYGDLVDIKDILKDRKTTSFRLVLTPEQLVLQESMRVYAYLSLHGFQTDCVIVNKDRGALPRRNGSPGESVSEKIRETFPDLKILRLEHARRDPTDRQVLLGFAREVYRQADPLRVMSRTNPIEYEIDGGGIKLFVRMPGLRKSELKLHTHNRHLVLEARNVRRIVPLPDSFSEYQADGARLEGGILRVDFKPNVIRKLHP
ncbi:MAG: ArsA family ATPase [Nitrospirae bacterium]|nr:ArsA family ATPase [Nitrospirota bacterium]